MDEELGRIRDVIDRGSPALAAFDYLVAHALAAKFSLVPRLSGMVRSVELRDRLERRNPFSGQVRPGHVNFYLRRPALAGRPGLFAAAVAEFGPVAPNGLGEYRTRIRDVGAARRMLAFLRREGAWPGERHARRFSTNTFAPVSAGHLLSAARRLAAGFVEHPFGPSTDYDVVFDGQRLPPKAVFGLAASEALGFEVLPENFRGGEGTFCFDLLRANGFPVVSKAEPVAEDVPLTDEDRAWAEGRMRLVTHLRRERATGLAAAKRAQARALDGRLRCERCGIDPVETFGSMTGEACIEVHHRTIAVADMKDAHATTLDELQCLCANCHRVTHREMRDAERTEGGTR